MDKGKPVYLMDNTDLDREISFDKEDSFFERSNSRKDTSFYRNQKEAMLTPEPYDTRQQENKSTQRQSDEPESEAPKEKAIEKNELIETIKGVIKFILSNLSLLIILGVYTGTGAWMFQ